MIFTKSDNTFERAANSESERISLLRKLQKRRNLCFWGSVLAFVAFIPLTFTMLAVGVRSHETVHLISKVFRPLGGFSLALLGASMLLNQDIKMLILSAEKPNHTEAQKAEQ